MSNFDFDFDDQPDVTDDSFNADIDAEDSFEPIEFDGDTTIGNDGADDLLSFGEDTPKNGGEPTFGASKTECSDCSGSCWLTCSGTCQYSYSQGKMN